MNSDTKDSLAGLLAIALAFAFIIALHGAWSAMEARSYNRITGANVTVWDAMWVQLRVDCFSGRGGAP